MSNKKKTQPAEAVEAEVKEPEVVETEAEEATEEAGATEEVAEAVETDTKPKMYVGPTIPGVGIQNRVYTEIPEGAASLIVEHPEFGNLFIDIEEYPKANRMLRERTGYIFSAFSKALEYKNNNK